jgi:hypothetical protein
MNNNPVDSSQTEISQLVHRYAYNIRSGKAEDCAALFAPDAIFEIREFNPMNPAPSRTLKKLVGRDAIIDYVVSTSREGIVICPLIHNLIIEIQGDTAEGNCMMTTRTWPAGHEVIGEYQDSFRRQGDWLFQARVYTIFRG